MTIHIEISEIIIYNQHISQFGSLMLKLNLAKCMLCGGCVPVCPLNLITCYTTTLEININDCTECGECVNVCPVGALDIDEYK